jgi:hypothetical protein
MTLELYLASDGTTKWTRSGLNLVNGWNLLRWGAAEGTITGWGNAYAVRFVVAVKSAIDITIGHIWLECPEKAQILFIEDGGYQTFLNLGYPDLKDRGIPVTWSIDPAKLGTTDRITEADVEMLSKENENSINFHGYDGSVTSSMTPEQIRADCVQAIKWLERRGYYGGSLWRSAWVQNTASNAAAAKSLFLAYATPSNLSGITCFPFTDRWNIPRASVHASTQDTIDLYFNRLKQTHQLLVIYTHGINETGDPDTTPSQWQYFLSKIDQGIAEGWLEGVTFEQLIAANGVKFRRGMGDWITELYNKDGSSGNVRLP